MPPTSQTDWKRLASMTDEQIDYSDIPPLTDEFFAHAQLNTPFAVALEPDVWAWFQKQGYDSSKVVNQVLREYIAIQKSSSVS